MSTSRLMPLLSRASSASPHGSPNGFYAARPPFPSQSFFPPERRSFQRRDEVAEIVRLTLEATARGATHWSLRSLAKAVGLAPSTIHRIWKAFSLQPHRAETFKLSTDPLFVEKVRDIVGLYLSPPERAIVLCPLCED